MSLVGRNFRRLPPLPGNLDGPAVPACHMCKCPRNMLPLKSAQGYGFLGFWGLGLSGVMVFVGAKGKTTSAFGLGFLGLRDWGKV